MHIVIEIPESEIPKHQEVIEIPLHFIDGKVCEAGGYEFAELPKGHGDLVDFDKLCREYWDGNYMEIHRNDLQSIKPIIEADTERSRNDTD